MRSTSRGSKKQRLDVEPDMWGLDVEEAVPDEQAPVLIPAPTGLSDDDAARWMALRFDPCARFCRNCEAYCVVATPEDGPACPSCQFHTLSTVGADPINYERKLRK